MIKRYCDCCGNQITGRNKFKRERDEVCRKFNEHPRQSVAEIESRALEHFRCYAQRQERAALKACQIDEAGFWLRFHDEVVEEADRIRKASNARNEST